MAGAEMNGIKARLKSVKSTMQITGAMELVATSKLRRAKEKVERTRPFYEILARAISDVTAAAELTDSVYTKPGISNKTLYIVIAGDRGLAGGYNSNIFRLASRLISDGDLVLPIGKKSCEHYRSRNYELLGDSVVSAAELGVGDALELGESVTDGFLRGEYGRVILVYTKFVSMMTQSPVYEQLLPMELENGEDSRAIPEYDYDPEEMLASIVPKYIGSVLYSSVCESVASESGARRSAMNAANKNAKEMVDTLMLRFNRARQAIITQEITEIVSGAEAL